MKLQAIHTIIRRPGKGKEAVHSPKDRDDGMFECPDDEGQTYLDMGAARLIEASKKTAKKPAKKPAKEAVAPAAVTGQTGGTGDDAADDDAAGGTNSEAEGGSDDEMLG